MLKNIIFMLISFTLIGCTNLTSADRHRIRRGFLNIGAQRGIPALRGMYQHMIQEDILDQLREEANTRHKELLAGIHAQSTKDEEQTNPEREELYRKWLNEIEEDQ